MLYVRTEKLTPLVSWTVGYGPEAKILKGTIYAKSGSAFENIYIKASIIVFCL